MSLILMNRGKPPEIAVKTVGVGDLVDTVFFGRYEIGMEDFLEAAHYVLTNTNLEKDDPRRRFVECVKRMREDTGWMDKGTRFVPDDSPVDEEANTEPDGNTSL